MTDHATPTEERIERIVSTHFPNEFILDGSGPPRRIAAILELWEVLKPVEAEVARLAQQVEAVRTLATDAQRQSENSLSRMFGGGPFPAYLPAADVLRALGEAR